jgi:hypothetical protein
LPDFLLTNKHGLQEAKVLTGVNLLTGLLSSRRLHVADADWKTLNT